MAKQGQHQNDSRGARTGRNNPTEAVTITAGTPKNGDTYEAQARERRHTARVAQASAPKRSTMDSRDQGGPHTRADRPRSGRSGSDSNAGAKHEGHRA